MNNRINNKINNNSLTSDDFVIVPFEKISEEALDGLINEFILREGTDYGQKEYTLQEKHEQLKKQLISGKIKIVFDSQEQTASLIRSEHLSSARSKDFCI